MPKVADVIVAGLGAMGSATASALARRGARVLGLDRFHPPHDRGSSHGETRVIRAAYFEHPLYVPLVRAAYDRWRALEDRSGRRLLLTTGVLLVGEPSGELMVGAAASAKEHGVPCEPFTHDELLRRYPAIVPAATATGLLEPGGGLLYPEACIEAFLDEAGNAGADLRYDEPLASWRAVSGGVEVETARDRYSAARLLIAAGAWIPTLMPSLPLSVERQVLHWFEPPDRRPFSVGALPVFLFEEAGGPLWYGTPDLGSGLKVGLHHQGAPITPETIDRAVHEDDVAAVRRLLRQRMPGADVRPSRSTVCMYTNTPDAHFLVDEHPQAPRVLLASACSGHGFKFASILGELLADRLTDTRSALDLAPFRLDRAALRTRSTTSVLNDGSER
ncbi:MAG TPA: N-methyl-L-tryptophan oxidase [Thermoanaerobaculia bacterium]|nr:N-methyl-L-tryptophan oxidase [Thermoanaerobaculia bacterium]